MSVSDLILTHFCIPTE